MTIGNAWGNEALDYVFAGNGTWLALHVADPGPDGNLVTEVSGGSYARKEALWTPAASRTVTLAVDVIFEDMPKCILTHVAVWKTLDGTSKIVASAPFPSSVSVGISDRVIVQTGEFTISL